MAIITVNGKINKKDLGITLPHEHLFVDIRFNYKIAGNPDDEKRFSTEKVSIKNLYLLKYNP